MGVGAQQAYDLPVTVNGKLNYIAFPCDSPDDFTAIKKEVEDIDFKSEEEMSVYFGRLGMLLGVRAMCHRRPNYSPNDAAIRTGEAAGCFPFADFTRGLDVVDAFGIRECADAIKDIVEKVRRTVALEEPHYKAAMANCNEYFTKKQNGETF